MANVFSYELGVFIGICILSGFILLSLLIICGSLSKTSPCTSIINATFTLFLMFVSAVAFGFVHFRLVYMLDYCEQVFEVTDINQIPAIGEISYW